MPGHLIQIFIPSHFHREYGNYPKILYSNFADKMAYVNNADPDQTDYGLCCLVFHHIFYEMHKKGKKNC